MEIKFKPVGVIKARLGIQRYGPAHKHFAQRCQLRMNARYVPGLQKGQLATNSEVSNKCEIIYKHPGSHYQYIGKLYVDPITGKGAFYNKDYGYWSRPKKYGIKKEPTDKDLHYSKAGTGPYWDKKMVSAEMSEIEKEVENYVKRGGK